MRGVEVPLGEVGQAEPPVVPVAVASEHHDHDHEGEDEDDCGDDEEVEDGQ